MPVAQTRPRAYLPRAPASHLVRAALLDGELAADAWREGRTAFETPESQRDPAATWLGPLLSATVERVAPNDPLLPSLRVAADRTQDRNEHLFSHVAGAVRALESAGIGAMLLKGAALVSGQSEAARLRPMSDADVLVPVEDALRAVDAITSGGWKARHAVTPGFLKVKHAAHFADADGCQLDLHWYVFEECCVPGIDAGIWQRSEPAGFLGTSARRPAPADALLHACVHGARWTRTPGIRWVSDAWHLMATDRVDWRTFVDEAVARSLVVRARSTLGYLRRELDAPIPASVVHELHRYRPGLNERLEHAALSQEQRRLGALPSYWFTFKRRARPHGALALLGFPAYLAAAWEVESVGALVSAAARRALARLQGGAYRGPSG